MTPEIEIKIQKAIDAWQKALDKQEYRKIIFKEKDMGDDIQFYYHKGWNDPEYQAYTTNYLDHNGQIDMSTVAIYEKHNGYKPTSKQMDNTILHEIGHALSLDHVKNDNMLMTDNGMPRSKTLKISECDAFAVLEKNMYNLGTENVMCTDH